MAFRQMAGRVTVGRSGKPERDCPLSVLVGLSPTRAYREGASGRIARSMASPQPFPHSGLREAVGVSAMGIAHGIGILPQHQIFTRNPVWKLRHCCQRNER